MTVYLDLEKLGECFINENSEYSVSELADRYFGNRGNRCPQRKINEQNRWFGAELSKLVRVENRYSFDDGYEIVRTIDNKRTHKEYKATNENKTICGLREIKEYLRMNADEEMTLSIVPTYKNKADITYRLVKREG